MFVVIREDNSTEEKVAYLFNTKEDAAEYMLKDYKETKKETFEYEEEIYGSGIDDSHAFIETEITEYRWDVIEVLK